MVAKQYDDGGGYLQYSYAAFHYGPFNKKSFVNMLFSTDLKEKGVVEKQLLGW